MSSSPTATYTYTKAGTYQITLTVTDATGAQTTTSHSVNVPSGDPGVPQPPVTPPPPPVSSANPTAAIALTSQSYLGVSLSGAGSAPGNTGAALVKYAWDFGDGTTLTNGSLTYGTTTAPYTSNSVWNIPIPANPTIDPNNAAIKAAVLNDGTTNIDGSLSLVVNLAVYSYGQPCYTSTPGQTRKAVTGSLAFGSAPSTIPWDSSWAPNSGSDAKINIFDVDNHVVYEFDGFAVNATTGALSTYYGVARNYVTEVGDGSPPGSEGNGPTGSGLDQVGGMIRIADVNAGVINHALSFLTSNPMGAGQTTDGTYFRYPASHSDGTRTLANGLMEGMRIQLDPTINLAAIPGITAMELMVGTALQKYGAYCTDTGGNNNLAMGFYCEKPTTTADPYPGVGVASDWQVLKHIPRSGLRVLDKSVTFKGMTNPNTSAPPVTTTHTYAASGTYTVSLTVTDSGSRTGNSTQSVSVGSKVNQPPIAALSATANQLTVSLDGSKSTDADGTIASYHWGFGDGTTATTTTSNTTHTFSTGGTYKLTLYCVDNSGASSSTVSTNISVTTPVTPAPVPAPTPAPTPTPTPTPTTGPTQPTGANITSIQSLVKKAPTLTAQINNAPATHYVSFDNAKYTWDDFKIAGATRYEGRGVDVNVPIGLLGSGIGKTVFEMNSGSTNKYTAPGAKSYMATGETTALEYWYIDSQVKKLDGFTLQGVSIGDLSKRYDGSAATNESNGAATDSPYIYNGMYLHQLANATVSNVHVNGIPGSDRVNPGETFHIAAQKCSGMTFDNVNCNGSIGGTASGATGFGINYHTGTLTVNNCEAHNMKYSAGIALYSCSGTANITNFTSDSNYRHLNFEQNKKGMTVNVHNPVLGSNGSGIPLYFGANSSVSGAGSIKFNMYDPVDLKGKAITSLTIQCASTYAGSTNLQSRNDIKIYVNGKDKTSSIVNWK